MPSEFFATPLFGITLTIVVYALAQMLYRRTGSLFCNPVALSILGIILLLLACRIPYRSYAVGGHYILFLLGPSVVALAVPLYARRREIWARRTPILVGVAAGGLASVMSASGLAWLLGGSHDVVLSLAPKSVTTPIAISIVEKIGGIAPLTAALVVMTGCLGAICGPEFCRLIGLRNRVAIGLAVGTAAHGIGTARMLEVDRLGGAVAGLAIGLNGLLTAFLLPMLFLLFS
ncbi:LrgB family protein [Geothermobacter hydrogeniphilus]|uniref:CidB/LrgB family autolysis modulator n=1 Tax=Geothermobacter hydrogeniphilus TaxID=1969733 RepID=A0A1X0YDR7_9BACT|nr:LrgB family protein [Geothermobacter hydrogeniphilus]ORJ63308.1 CidB/LrgB family autolysis modulator [Geothermobacter hydrogeniphilus]